MADIALSAGFVCMRDIESVTEVFEAAESGDAVLLAEVFQELGARKRARLLASSRYGRSTPLLVAAEHGNLDCVKVILKYKADVGSGSNDDDDDTGDDDDSEDDDDNNKDDDDDDGTGREDNCISLMKASECGHRNVVSFLFEHGANLDFQDKEGSTPLIKASENGHVNVVSFLVEHGAKLNFQDKEGNTAFMLASKNGHMGVVTFLVECGANVDFQNKAGNTALMLASQNGHMSVVTFLVKCRANINLQDKYGVSALMMASNYSHVNIETFLIEQGGKVDLQDKDGKTVLHHAIEHSSGRKNFEAVFETVRSLIKNGANIDASTNDNCTPLMTASKEGDVQVINLLVKQGANVDLQDKVGRTALHHAIENNISQIHCDRCLVCPFRFCSNCDSVVETVRCLIKNGADVNANTNDNCTPLMLAAKEGAVRVIDLLIKHGAKVDIQNKKGESALFHAITHSRNRGNMVKTVKCLIKNGADVNASTNDNCTPLMIAASSQLDLVTFLIESGANVDLQDKNGDTALHYAVRPRDGYLDPCNVVNALLSCGAAQLCNNQQLTPLLLASNNCQEFVVRHLLKRAEYTKEQRIDALELLGASLVAIKSYDFSVLRGGFDYIRRGMEERFQDSSLPLLKQPMEPIEAYENRKECQTLEELAQIKGDKNAIIMESLIIRERILGTDNPELLGPIRLAANYCDRRNSYEHECIGLYRHAMKIAQHCNQSVTSDLNHLTSVLYGKGWWNVPPRQKDFVLELLEQTVLEYEKQQKVTIDFRLQNLLFNSLMQLVQIIANFKHIEESKTTHVSVLLRKLFHLNPRDRHGNTLLHMAVQSYPCFAFEYKFRIFQKFPVYKFPCISTVKLLLNAGINVDAFNNNGHTPLHKAVRYKPSSDNIHCLTEILEALLDGGAHHDYVNNKGKTAMDLAQTDEARMILSEKRKLELKCITARAVKKFGLPYLGVVPKTLEKYIGMH